MLTAPAIPMLFQGQEFMEDGSFNDWRALDWHKTEQYAGIRLAHQHLIALRKNQYNNSRGLTGQSCQVIHTDESNKLWAYHRWDKGGPHDDVVVIINASNTVLRNYRVPLPQNGIWHVCFNSDWKGYSADFGDIATQTVIAKDGTGVLDIGAYSAVVVAFSD